MISIAKSFVARQGGIIYSLVGYTLTNLPSPSLWLLDKKVIQLVMCKVVVCSMKVFRDTYKFEGSITLLNSMCS